MKTTSITKQWDSRSSVLEFVLCKTTNWNGNGKPGFEARIDPKGIVRVRQTLR